VSAAAFLGGALAVPRAVSIAGNREVVRCTPSLPRAALAGMSTLASGRPWVSAASFVAGALAVPVISLSATLLYPASSPSNFFFIPFAFSVCVSLLLGRGKDGFHW
jgi:hypothetical protein